MKTKLLLAAAMVALAPAAQAETLMDVYKHLHASSMPSLHSPFFKPDAAAAIPVGVDTMTATAVSLFNE